MLTLVESLSLAGDRGKQNDDACGARTPFAWVIDGATDLHSAPESAFASDAAWLATLLNKRLYDGLHHPSGLLEEDFRRVLAFSSRSIEKDWSYKRQDQVPRWKSPTASVLIAADAGGEGLHGLDLGDCRCFALGADGAAHAIGGPKDAAADEQRAAALAGRGADPAALLRDAGTLELLRAKRALHNTPDGYWVFGLQPECADHARYWRLNLARPAHILLMTDGFSALVDRYHVYDAAGLVRAALASGLQELGRELRAIEAADAAGAKHPRFKPSDDATAILLRLT
ncbi:MAG TPA: protein phosphatase 2C domain-containing protein [Terricaulis sp.]|nr:protein phosphatase 2C domain-containing protein [Terricaulis sp.]